jgi:ribosome assembly protein 1
VLNKIDRLVNQLKMTPLEAYEHIKKVIAQVNAVQALFISQQAFEVSIRARAWFAEFS